MRIWIVLTVLMFAMSWGNDTFNLFEDLFEKTERQSNVINLNILAIFTVSIVTSVLANVLLGETSPGSNNIDCTCGVELPAPRSMGTENRIIGGQAVAFPNKYPWMTIVFNAQRQNPCGGSIVASRFVLTAASCLFTDTTFTDPLVASDLMVRIGDHEVPTETEQTTLMQKNIQIERVIIHEDFEPTVDNSNPPIPLNLVNDIALLELSEELDLEVYTPVCLAETGLNEAGTNPAHTYGWGATVPFNICQNQPIHGPSSFIRILQETELRICDAVESDNEGLLDSQLCAVGATSAPYLFDEGGPLTIKNGNQHVQVGAFSFVQDRCPTLPLVEPTTSRFSRISGLRGWLDEKMAGATTCGEVDPPVCGTSCIVTTCIFIWVWITICPNFPECFLPPLDNPPLPTLPPTSPPLPTPTTPTPPQPSDNSIRIRRPDPIEDFGTFVQMCNKNYINQDEENRRRDIFTSNLEIIRRGQFEFDNGQTTYDLRVNCAGDLSFEEFVTQYLGQGSLGGDGPDVFIDPNIDPEIFTQRIVRSRRRDYQSFPTELDWEKRGFVTPVLDQSPCNSCAAHAASSALESCLAIGSNTAPVPKSQQQLVDCTNGFVAGNGTEMIRTNKGCETGYADVHLQWLQETQTPHQDARDYPLRPDEPAGECANNGYGPDYFNYIVKRQVSSSSKRASYEYKYFSDEIKLMELLQNGPVATWLDVAEDFQFYGGGVYYNTRVCGNNEDEAVPPECAKEGGGYTCHGDCKRKLPQHCDRFFNVPRFNAKGLYGHAVTVVGYGTDSAGWDFWRIKNSWGTDKGEDGYHRVFRGVGHCGVGSFWMQPICV